MLLPLSEESWRKLDEKHRIELEPFVLPHLERANRNTKHPVIDFLFRYYSFRPQQLLKWGPGVGVALIGGTEQNFPDSLGYVDIKLTEQIPDGFSGNINKEAKAGRTLDPSKFPKKRLPFLEWVLKLQKAIFSRAPRYSCFGLHEWAMLYDSSEIRHTNIPLRVSHKIIKSVVDNHQLSCTHFDAYRFFSKEAIPLNDYQLNRETTINNEQSGCIHNNMDLYKWCYKLSPWISSDLLRSAFLLAIEARIVDMEASPYDITPLGFGTIPIETDLGKATYVDRQRTLQEKAQLIRVKLISELENLSNNLEKHNLTKEPPFGINWCQAT